MTTLHTFLSPAKVNLFLKTLRKRKDGYHDILSLMQPVSLYDEISLGGEDGKGIFIACDNKSIPCDQTNLVYRAAEAFSKAAGISKKLSGKIKKNIPVAAGLGGGSSNAAAVLKALNEIVSANISVEKLMQIGAALGSDVPFFIAGKACIASGRGEILDPVELPRFWNINITISKVKASCCGGRLEDPQILHGILINDLEDVTIRKHPEIKEVKKVLIDFGAVGALMSGSGPTVFGIFMSEDKARKAFGQIKQNPRYKDMAVFVAQGIE